jgi:DNA-binding CsgD family transcriptional regulator
MAKINPFQEVSDATTGEELLAAVVKAALPLGYPNVVIGTIYTTPDGKRHRLVWDNHSAARQAFIEQQGPYLFKNDPTVAHMRKSPKLLVWDREYYEQHKAMKIWQMMQGFQITAGVIASVFIHNQGSVTLAVDRPTDHDEHSTHELTLAKLLLLCDVVTEKVVQLHFQAFRTNVPRLTARELEVLKWATSGKTAFEVGVILGIAERTVSFHLQNAIHKFETDSKHVAVARAKSYGLITL